MNETVPQMPTQLSTHNMISKKKINDKWNDQLILVNETPKTNAIGEKLTQPKTHHFHSQSHWYTTFFVNQ